MSIWQSQMGYQSLKIPIIGLPDFFIYFTACNIASSPFYSHHIHAISSRRQVAHMRKLGMVFVLECQMSQ